ncbi:hypothetical protein GIB67_007360 [Kingdonia uniflora]|uniref:HTH myb-type domain-containing protein n=1 Tax=Kingdonia uniflora TaxID=39325 RepID=A0A7J7NXF6_9MAGN|nr:hypothetical protein GIB67_007360 [Kingdonia uniflora]
MNMQNMQDQGIGSIMSPDAKPRLKWTPELHHHFVEAVTQLGGAEKATPKSVRTVMGIPGLTLYHLKSHLQKYRLGKNQQLDNETCFENTQDYRSDIGGGEICEEILARTQTHAKENPHVTQALHLQIEVQKKLNEQIEMQRRLQLQIEAQGMYLESVLKRAQETLAGYNSSCVRLEDANTKDCSLTSSDSLERKDERLHNLEKGAILSLMQIEHSESSNTGSSNHDGETKRSRSTISGKTSFDPPSAKRSGNTIDKLPKSRKMEKHDLNNKLQSKENLGWEALDLNHSMSL